jgi:hypothetical protein
MDPLDLIVLTEKNQKCTIIIQMAHGRIKMTY